MYTSNSPLLAASEVRRDKIDLPPRDARRIVLGLRRVLSRDDVTVELGRALGSGWLPRRRPALSPQIVVSRGGCEPPRRLWGKSGIAGCGAFGDVLRKLIYIVVFLVNTSNQAL